MPDTKQDALDMLRELTELTLLEEGDPQSFRVRAYENAAQSIASQANDLGRLSLGDLKKIHGVGQSTAEKVRELFETGRVEKLEALRQKYPASLVALLRLQGVGPKAVRRLQSELGVQSLDDLRSAIGEHRLRTLKGFGEKSEQRLRDAIARLEREGALTRTSIAIALPHAERLVAELAAVRGVTFAGYCGSLRRFSETVGDVDIVVASTEPAAVMDAVVALGAVDRVLVRGESKTSVVTRRGLQVDVRVVLPHQLGAALLYFTGSKSHNVKLRQRALARGYTLNEYALTALDGGAVIASETEEDVYRALGLPFIPPTLREDWGELEAAENARLPRAIEQLSGDFHVHTNLSGDGRSSLEEMVATARERGYGVLALTDHAEGTLSGVGRDAFLEQRARIAALQREVGASIRLLHGVELNIGPGGELDYDADFRKSFDFCIASIHSHFDLDRAAQTRRVVTAMADPSVRMIGHLTARIIGRRPPVEFDFEAVFDAACTTRTALELNGALPRLDPPLDALRAAQARGVTFVLTSDAHHTKELRLVDYAARYAHRAHLVAENVANAWPVDRLLSWATT
ncbi:MAG TPA: DNA polymerase/3'-5' exonuclease PolX [Polyangiaceae bacterium]|jgi:DNA polymerase (family 10)|nr:DNA polymerase/3'-5' exonuclease PolX [Polyangiaceae bacterium]